MYVAKEGDVRQGAPVRDPTIIHQSFRTQTLLFLVGFDRPWVDTKESRGWMARHRGGDGRGRGTGQGGSCLSSRVCVLLARLYISVGLNLIICILY